MRRIRLLAASMVVGAAAIGCGWSPPSPPPTSTQACGSSDAPDPDTVQQAIAGLPQGPRWRETARGNTPDCRLNWVVTQAGDASDSPMQVLFFDRATALGPATPEPRSYINVISTGNHTANVQYQWRQGQDPACCPTGIAAVRFQIGDDGKIKSLDPIPTP
jgi:hypothetical protein